MEISLGPGYTFQISAWDSGLDCECVEPAHGDLEEKIWSSKLTLAAGAKVKQVVGRRTSLATVVLAQGEMMRPGWGQGLRIQGVDRMAMWVCGRTGLGMGRGKREGVADSGCLIFKPTKNTGGGGRE
jgi:hypothetical protein